MKQVFTAESLVYIHHMRSLLEADGIDCIIKNDRLVTLGGEVPVTVCWPELWITNPMLENRAKQIIERANTAGETEDSWVCENCGEEHSANFTDCWNCQDIKAF